MNRTHSLPTAARRAWLLGLLVGVVVLPGGGARAAEVAPESAEARVRAYLEERKAAAYRIVPLGGAPLATLLPGRAFFAVRFRQFPNAVRPPAPLRAQNLLVVGDGPPELVTEARALQAFFAAALPPVRDDQAARSAGEAWLLLDQELAQDGFYEFQLPPDSPRVARKDGGREVTARAVVSAGGKGEISAVLTFDAAGRLTAVTDNRRLLPGVRPICQATKLLDPDPVVRGMAERDILVMGRAGADYLTEQRAGASPELRRAIDRLWRRILDEGW